MAVVGWLVVAVVAWHTTSWSDSPSAGLTSRADTPQVLPLLTYRYVHLTRQSVSEFARPDEEIVKMKEGRILG